MNVLLLLVSVLLFVSTILWLRAARDRDLWMLDAVAMSGRIARLERRNAHLEASRDDACVEATKQRRLAEAAGRQVDESDRVLDETRALLAKRMVEVAP